MLTTGNVFERMKNAKQPVVRTGGSRSLRLKTALNIFEPRLETTIDLIQDVAIRREPGQLSQQVLDLLGGAADRANVA